MIEEFIMEFAVGDYFLLSRGILYRSRSIHRKYRSSIIELVIWMLFGPGPTVEPSYMHFTFASCIYYIRLEDLSQLISLLKADTRLIFRNMFSIANHMFSLLAVWKNARFQVLEDCTT